MNWLKEARAAVRRENVDVVEMSETVVVKFERTWLRLRSDRSIDVERQRLSDAERKTTDAIVGRLDRRVWR